MGRIGIKDIPGIKLTQKELWGGRLLMFSHFCDCSSYRLSLSPKVLMATYEILSIDD